MGAFLAQPEQIFVQLLTGLAGASSLFLVASGLSIIFGVTRIVNFAHGSFYMLGAYLAWSLAAMTGSFTLAIACGAALSVVFGLLLERLLFRHFYQRDHLSQVLLTFGLIYIFEELRSILWGDDVHGVKVPEILSASVPLTDNLSYPVYRLFMSGVCIALALGLYLLISRTRLGMKIRAGASNRDMTESLGVNIKFIHAIVFAIGVTLATVAGMIASPVSSVYPNMGSQVLIISFVVVVIGGIGSVRGALIAALLVGLVDTFGKVLLPQLAGMLIYMLMAAVLLWKPEGLFRQ
jgi:branched-chain amino acid transport system permease protein